MNKKQLVLWALLICLCFSSISLWLTSSRSVQTIREDLSDHILRFHVLANSDSKEDQALKMEVKTAVLNYMEASLPEDADLEETKAFIRNRENEIHALAASIIAQEGYDYPVSLYLEPWYFPTKTYGDLTFPCGTYEAFRIVIGNGEGQNWWCVLYPSLCFVDATYSTVPDSSKEELKSLLDEDTYNSLLGQKEKNLKGKIQISFKLGEFLSSLF